jgi:predicted secreted protein
MKTAMQELIEWANNRVIMRSMISPNELLEQLKNGLEKEKEQIVKAFNDGYSNYDSEMTSIEYYNQTYNPKQHIIDIMKADEDDDLYNQIN